MTDIWTKAFWKRLIENDIHVFAGGMLGVLTGKALGIAGLAALPWHAAFDAGGFAVIVSTLATIASQPVPNTPPGSFIPPKDSEV